MSNLQNRNPNNREVPPGDDGNNVGRNVAYRDGYLHGRVSERRVQEDSQEVRDNNNAARGLLIGVALTSLVGLTLAALFLLNRRQEEPAPLPVIVPTPQATQSPQAQQTPQAQTTVIERTVERVPQVIATPASPNATTQRVTTQPAPRVNVTVPTQPAPRVTVTVSPQPAPRVNVTVPPQQPTSGSQNSTINILPNPPASSRTGTSGANSTTTITPSTTEGNSTSGSGAINVTPNSTGTNSNNTDSSISNQ